MKPLIILLAFIVLSGCQSTPPSEIPPGYVQLPITKRVVTQEKACALALVARAAASTGINAVSGPALVELLRRRGWGDILQARYCQDIQAEAEATPPAPILP